MTDQPPADGGVMIPPYLVNLQATVPHGTIWRDSAHRLHIVIGWDTRQQTPRVVTTVWDEARDTDAYDGWVYEDHDLQAYLAEFEPVRVADSWGTLDMLAGGVFHTARNEDEARKLVTKDGQHVLARLVNGVVVPEVNS